MDKDMGNIIKNVVLVTWIGSNNYGTCLQAFALHAILENLGYKVKFLQAVPHLYGISSYTKCILYHLGILKLRRFINSFKMSKKAIKTKIFHEKRINNIELFTKRQEQRLVNETDCFLAGSDQIWNTYFRYTPFSFLAFAGNVKRVAYASSIGTNDINEEHCEEVKGLLLKFNHIGVREAQAVSVLTELTGRKDITQVLDPTFLLTPNDWSIMAKDADFEISLPDKYLFCYLLGKNSNYLEQLNDIKNRMGIKNIIIVPAIENLDISFSEGTIYKNAGPVEFVYLIQHASLVCTDSFHVTALSINHSIPFIEFIRFTDEDQKSQNSRIYDVLEHFSLSNRIYKRDSLEWTKPINYQFVQEVLRKDRDKSLNYLINSIEN